MTPATRVFLVLLKVILTLENNQTSHALDVLWPTLMFAVEGREAEVALAVHTGVW